MTKELTHRGDELKGLGWSQEDVFRYVELWEYRQRWGSINLEREDRQFLRKAEAVLPEVSKVKSSVKKSITDKSYYRWLSFYLNEMKIAERNFDISDGSRGLWSIIVEEELRALDYYQPVLGVPDTIKAKSLKPIREELINKAEKLLNSTIQLLKFDFKTPLENLNQENTKSWKPLRDESIDNSDYPIIDYEMVDVFRKEVRSTIVEAIREIFPSLANTDKPAPPEDWIPK